MTSTPWGELPRTNWITLHHSGGHDQFASAVGAAAGGPSSECASTGGTYDFAVNGYGAIDAGPRRLNSAGCHAKGCNCQSLGIRMMGCFGGCDSTVDICSLAQACSIAQIWAYSGVGRTAAKLKPHRYCGAANPCGVANPTATVCCGTRYTGNFSANDYWTPGDGLTLRNNMLTLANNWAAHGTCA